jgi:cellulose synthase/poly-beta-1,6-N-acetylglucosamine synthase-like glycosyltransferase
MNWSKWIRQVHRWLSMAFTAGFIVNILALSSGGVPPFWVYLTVLIPLFLLFPTGLYMFALPYVAGWRSGRRARTQA